MSNSSVRLHLRTPLAPLAMRVTDHNRKVVATGDGEIDRRVRPGLYVLQIFAGPKVERRFLTVGPEGYEEIDIQVEIPSAAPIGGTSTVHEFHGYPAMNLSQNPMQHFGDGGRLVIFVRNMGKDPQARVMVDGLELLGSDLQTMANATDHFKQMPNQGWAGYSADVEPGGYVLRITRPQRRSSGDVMETVDQSIWVEEGWITLVFVPFRTKQGFAEPENASVHMSHIDSGFDPYVGNDSEAANIALEVALSGLRQGRAVVPKGLQELMLRGKFGSPMLGLVGAIALLQSPKPNWTLLDTVRRNLGRLVPNHPDLHAIHLMQKQARGDLSTSRVPEISWPPMLFACYRGVIERDGSEANHLIAANSLADLAAARLYSQGPWTRWQALQQAEQSSRSQMWEQRLQQVLEDTHRVTETAGLSNKVVQELKKSWNNALKPAVKSSRKRRVVLKSSELDSKPIRDSMMKMGTARASVETTLVANQIQELTEQIAKKQLVASDEIFNLRSLSRQTGLPMASVMRALKSIADRGFKF